MIMGGKRKLTREEEIVAMGGRKIKKEGE